MQHKYKFISEEYKICSHCNIEKHKLEFYSNKDNNKKYKLSNVCKPCYCDKTKKVHLLTGKEQIVIDKLNNGINRFQIAKELGVNIQTLGKFIKDNVKIIYVSHK